MPTGDTLTDALAYALEQSGALKQSGGGAVGRVGVINASGREDARFEKQSHHDCYSKNYTLNGVFNTLLVRASRQIAETLGFIGEAYEHADKGARIFIAQENTHGAASLEKHIKAAFEDVTTYTKQKCRVMVAVAASARVDVLEAWRAGAAMCRVQAGGFWSQPGLFGWDRVDAGSRLLLAHLPDVLLPESGLKGGNRAVADLGCGYGYLSMALLKKKGVGGLFAADIDARAVMAAGKNLEDAAARMVADGQTPPTFTVTHADATKPIAGWPPLACVIMNPPFHNQLYEDRALGQAFCEAALKMLQSGGRLYLVANRHMPYESILAQGPTRARAIRCLNDTNGFKILYAEKP